MAEIEFKDLGKIPIPDKGDVKTEKMTAEIEKKITKEQLEGQIREDTGTAPEKKGTLTKDVPQMAFRIIGGFIDCKRFELSEDEAQIFATHLNILLPLEGKVISLFIILMIVLNKVYLCLDKIKAMQNKGGLEPEQPKRVDLPEPLS